MNSAVKAISDLIYKEDPGIHPMIVMNSIHYLMGAFTSINRVKYSTISGSSVLVNYFGLTLAPSGKGKDRSVDLAKQCFSGAAMAYSSELTKRYSKFNSSNPDDAVPLPEFEFQRATPEGFLQNRVNISTVGYGVSCLKIPEIQDMLSNVGSVEFFSDITIAWEKGESGAKSNRGKPIPSVYGVPANIIVYGSPVGVHSASKEKELLSRALATGLARRTFLVSVSKEEVDALAKAKYDSGFRPSNNEDEFDKLRSKIKEVFDQGEVTLSMTPDALDRYYEYDEECGRKYIGVEAPEGIIAEMGGRAWKMSRLAAMYAYFEGHKNVEVSDVEGAIEFTDKCGAYAQAFMEDHAPHEMLVHYLIESSVPVTKQELAKKVLNTTTMKAVDDAIMFAEEYADTIGHIIFTKKHGNTIRYGINSMTNTDEDNVTISVSKSMGDGYETITGKFDDLTKVTTGVHNYSAGTFKDGKRSNENYEESQDLIILDVDGGMSFEVAKSFFSDYRCIISTTKNNMKEKNGDVNERFRVILLADKKIELDAETFRSFMINVINLTGVPADMNATDAARLYYPYTLAETWTSKGTKRFEIGPCLPNTTKAKDVHKKLEKYDNVEGIERFFIAETVDGNRNNSLFRYAALLKMNDGLSDEVVEEKVRALNSKIADPLPERELAGTILKSIKRKK